MLGPGARRQVHGPPVAARVGPLLEPICLKLFDFGEEPGEYSDFNISLETPPSYSLERTSHVVAGIDPGERMFTGKAINVQIPFYGQIDNRRSHDLVVVIHLPDVSE